MHTSIFISPGHSSALGTRSNDVVRGYIEHVTAGKSLCEYTNALPYLKRLARTLTVSTTTAEMRTPIALFPEYSCTILSCSLGEKSMAAR